MPATSLDIPEFKSLDLQQQITLLLRQNKELSQENNRLNNRFGLVWPEQPEFFVQVLSDDEVVYQNGVYAKVGTLDASGSKAVLKFNNGQSEELKRCDSPYLYAGKSSGKTYLGNGGAAYEWQRESQEHYMPTLTPKGHHFGFDNTERKRRNLLIEGDNYHALQVLQHTHRGAIDVIYIDPPYNTGNKDFKYNDKFVSDEDGNRHSAWLSFMKRRLLLARSLMASHAVIFISIDGVEGAHLKILCDQIFGEKNGIATFTWQRTSHGSKLSKTITVTGEYVIAYGRDKSCCPDLFWKMADSGKDVQLTNRTNSAGTLVFPVGTEVRLPDGVYHKAKVAQKGIPLALVSPVEVRNGVSLNEIVIRSHFKWQQSFLDNEIAQGSKIFFKSDGFTPNAIRHDQSEKTLNLKNILLKDDGFGTTQNGTDELDSLFGGSGSKASEKVYPKPTSLIKRLVNACTRSRQDAVVLDFFAGSGTTGHAVWDLNKEDGGSRTFILVTNNESNICEEVTYERLRRCNLPAHGNYGEGLEYLRLVHIAESDIGGNDMAQSFEYIKQVINVRFRSFSVVEETDDWYVTDKIAVLKNYVKYPEFFEKHGKHPVYGLVTKKERQSQSFRAEAAKRVDVDSIHVFNKEYLNDLYRIVRESNV